MMPMQRIVTTWTNERLAADDAEGTGRGPARPRGGGPPGRSAFATRQQRPTTEPVSERSVAFEPIGTDAAPTGTQAPSQTTSRSEPPGTTAARSFPGGRARLPLLSRKDGSPQVAFVGTAFSRAATPATDAPTRQSAFSDYFSTESLFGPGDSIATPLTPAHASDPCSVLGLEPDASWREIVRAHRALVKQNHPDHLGDLDDRARETAEARFREINEAYRTLKQAHLDRDGS